MSHNTQPTHDELPARYRETPKPDRSDRELAAERKRVYTEYLTREALRRAIDIKPARDLMRRDEDETRSPQQPRALFPPFWTQGQLALLTGPSTTDNSLLAVQLAETLSTGTQAPSPALPPGSPPYEGGV